MKAMILAAGRGQRLRPLTNTVPKPLLAVQGESLIERHIKRLKRAGFCDLVINIAWLGQEIRHRLGTGEDLGVSIRYSDEGDEVLETGGGIYRVLPWFEGQPFLVVNADIWTDLDFSCLTKKPDDLAHLALVRAPPYKNQGDFHLQEDRIFNQPPTFTFSGVGLYEPALFEGCQAGVYPLTPLLRAAADQGRLGGELYTGVWHDVGTPERLAELNR